MRQLADTHDPHTRPSDAPQRPHAASPPTSLARPLLKSLERPSLFTHLRPPISTKSNSLTAPIKLTHTHTFRRARKPQLIQLTRVPFHPITSTSTDSPQLTSKCAPLKATRAPVVSKCTTQSISTQCTKVRSISTQYTSQGNST